MTHVGQETQHRVVSRDGTEISYFSSGDGPPLVLVHGTTADHTRWRPLMPYLETELELHAMDRRGRGASGDAAGYDIEREFEDVAAVVDAVAASTGGKVDLLGHSYGGNCAFGAAALTKNVRRLLLYEGWPAMDPAAWAAPADALERMQRGLDAGENERVLEIMFREVVGMPEEELDAFRALPAWQVRRAAAPTIPRELQAVTDQTLDRGLPATVAVPTLVIVGGASPAAVRADGEEVAARLPHARVAVIEGQRHVAIDLVPERFAAEILAFLR